tara:strand:+ start:325 stop:600 length:276 start_codon:yes stop_codon:yes gene_type:complete
MDAPPCQLIKQALDLVELEPAIVPKFWSKFDIGISLKEGIKPKIPKLELFTNGHKVSERIGTVSDDPLQEARSIQEWVARAESDDLVRAQD